MSDTLLETKQILSRTPQVLKVLLTGLDESLLSSRKSENGFTPADVVSHLLANDEVNFINRMNYFLEGDSSKSFPRLDREYTERGFDKNLSLEKRLELFESLRKKNMDILEKNVTDSDLDKKSVNPGLGGVTLMNLLSYWVVHDLTHIYQVIEVLGLHYKNNVGPWGDYLKILKIPEGLAKTGID